MALGFVRLRIKARLKIAPKGTTVSVAARPLRSEWRKGFLRQGRADKTRRDSEQC